MRGIASLASRLQCVLLLLVVARTAAAGGVIYVDANAPGANNGSSWENAYVFLQDALADAETADKSHRAFTNRIKVLTRHSEIKMQHSS